MNDGTAHPAHGGHHDHDHDSHRHRKPKARLVTRRLQVSGTPDLFGRALAYSLAHDAKLPDAVGHLLDNALRREGFK